MRVSGIKLIRFLKLLLAAVLICMMCGCTVKKKENQFAKAVSPEMMIAAPLAANPQFFYCQSGSWPKSFNDLKFFCSDTDNKCVPIQWDRLDGGFMELPDSTLHIICDVSGTSDPCEILRLDVILNVPEPNFCTAYKTTNRERSDSN